MPNPKTKSRFQVHVVLFEIQTDEEGGEHSHLLEEEELAGYKDDFTDEAKAREVFSVVTGIDVRSMT